MKISEAESSNDLSALMQRWAYFSVLIRDSIRTAVNETLNPSLLNISFNWKNKDL
jgi:hypothetical protein